MGDTEAPEVALKTRGHHQCDYWSQEEPEVSIKD